MTIPWYDSRICCLDLETTGTDPEDARIVTACVALVGGGLPSEVRTWLADPGVEIPEEAAGVHGITTERARADGRPPAEVLFEISQTLDGYEYGVLVAFNARFDLTVIDREMRRHGSDDFAGGLTRIPVVDPFVLDRWLDRYRPGKRTLDAMCEHYGIARTESHTADADALDAGRLAWVLGRRGQVVRRVRSKQEGQELAALKREWERARGDVAALRDLQVREAAERAAGLEEYLRRGNPAKDVPPQPDAVVEREWPLIPFRETVGA